MPEPRTHFGLLTTGVIVSVVTIDGLANLLAAKRLVWLRSLIAELARSLPDLGKARITREPRAF
ncbi:MAG: hypothetical protein AAFV74_20635 [Pseudomonadota bacterium]